MGTTETRLKKKMASVLVLNLAKYFGGATVRTLQVARMLKAENYVFCVVALDQSSLHLRLLSEGLPVRPIKYGRGDFRTAFWLQKIIQEGGYDVIDTHNPQSHLWGLVASKLSGDCRVVTTVHGCYGEAEVGWRSVLYDKVLQWNDNRSACFIAVSGSVEQYLHKIGIQHGAIIYSENAVPQIDANDKGVTVRQLAGWSDETLIIAIAARLEAVKGIEYLIKAFALIAKDYPHLRLCIMGDGRLKEELERLTEKLGITNQVYFSGFREDVPTLLLSVDIFCLASLSEGLPFAVLEASMARLPLVLSEVGGLSEFFIQGQTALLFPAKNIQQLATHFKDLIEDKGKRKELGMQAYLSVSKRFSVQRMFKQTTELYNRARE